ncbi:MAG: hypothetical protein ABIJ45_10500 [Candidatus Zixiibacteriota bacterium]
MTDSLPNNKRIILALIILLVAIGTTIRFINLDSDPPSYFDGQNQSLSTDPYQYTHFSRNKILFDEWEIFDSSPWCVFKYSLISGLSYIIFKIDSVTRANANLTGLLLSLASIFLFLFSIRKFIGLRGILIAAVFLLVNKPLFVYGRLPYLENGMIFILSLIFFVFIYYRQKFWGQVLLGILVALSALAGKIFGFIIIVPIITALVIEKKKNALKPISSIMVSTIIVTFVWIYLFYGSNFDAFMRYYSSQTIGLYGIPDALKSPILFFERLISFGSESRFYYHAPALGVISFLCFLILIAKKSFDRNQLPIIIFLIFWLVASQLFFMVGNYRPLRYIYMIYLPLVGLVGILFQSQIELVKAKLNLKRLLALLFICWIFIYQVVLNLFYLDLFESTYQTIVWISLIPAVLLVVTEYRFNLISHISKLHFFRYTIIATAILSLVNFGWSYKNWYQQRLFNIKEAGVDIGTILNRNAVLCGPMAPTLLLENNLKGIIYAVGISDQDPDFFKKNPATHFLIDAEASGTIIKKFPELENAKTVGEYWIRDAKILLVRISDIVDKSHSSYHLTDYEIGKRFLDQREVDSAAKYIEQFHSYYSDCKSSMKTLGELLPMIGQVDEGTKLLIEASLRYPRDWSLHFLLGTHYQQRALYENNRNYLAMARQEYEKTLEINPYQWNEIETIINKIGK